MLVFSTEKYISTYADVFQLSVGDSGFLMVDKRTYDELNEARLKVDINSEKERLDIENNLSAISFFETYAPDPISRLAILFDRLSFEPPLDLEVLFGMISTLTTIHGVMSWFNLDKESFKLRRFSDLLLKEHIVPRKLFLTSCIPYEEMMHPEKAKDNVHQFLYLMPAGMTPAMQTMSAATGESGSTGICMDDDDQQYYIDRKDKYDYLGDGMFALKSDDSIVEISIYNNDYLLKEFGVEFDLAASMPSSVPDDSSYEDTTSQPVSTSAQPSELASDNPATTKSVAELFQRTRGGS